MWIKVALEMIKIVLKKIIAPIIVACGILYSILSLFVFIFYLVGVPPTRDDLFVGVTLSYGSMVMCLLVIFLFVLLYKEAKDNLSSK